MKAIYSFILSCIFLSTISGQNTYQNKSFSGYEKIDTLKLILQRNPSAFLEESFKVESQWIKENNENLLIELYELQLFYLDFSDAYDLTILTLHKLKQRIGTRDEQETSDHTRKRRKALAGI